MNIHDTSSPVVALISGGRQGPLGLVRSLGRAGVRVYSIESRASSPSFFSRYCEGRFRWDISKHSAAETLTFLQRVARRTGARPILIPTNDQTAIFVADNSDRLQNHFLIPKQSPSLVHALADKKSMYFLAKEHKIPTPQTVFPSCKADVMEFLEQAAFPIMLKGIDGFRLWKRTGKKMFIVSSERELLSTYDAAEDPECPNLMIQEYIPGGDDTVWMFNGYFNCDSECLIGVTGKKIRQSPIHTGCTSLGICLPNEEVEKTTKRFMKSVGYRGILDIGYRYDARDGLFKVLDINPRIGETFRLFTTTNGMDVVRALYLDLTGQPVPSGTIVQGRKWLVEDIDLISSYRYCRERELTVKEWFRSLSGIEEMAYFAKDDLLPALAVSVIRVAELFGRIAGRLLNVARDLAVQFFRPQPQTLTGYDAADRSNNPCDRSAAPVNR